MITASGLTLASIAIGCGALFCAVCFTTAAREDRRDNARVWLIASTGALALSISIATLAGRMMCQ